MSGTYREQAQELFRIRRRLEEISEEMSLAITIDYDLAGRMDRAVAALRAAQRKLEER